MDINEIINRPELEPIHQREMEYVVQEFIKDRKQVSVSIQSELKGDFMLNITLLNKAYEIARGYFINTPTF